MNLHILMKSLMQLYGWDHKYFYQVMHSDQEADAAESVSPTTSDLFGNGGVSEGDESVVGDEIVPYVAPISSEEKKKKPMRKGQRLDWEPVDLLKSGLVCVKMLRHMWKRRILARCHCPVPS